MDNLLDDLATPDTYERVAALTGLSPAEVEEAYAEMYADPDPDDTHPEDFPDDDYAEGGDYGDNESDFPSRYDYEESQILEYWE
jgi:hypothetical protein